MSEQLKTTTVGLLTNRVELLEQNVKRLAFNDKILKSAVVAVAAVLMAEVVLSAMIASRR